MPSHNAREKTETCKHVEKSTENDLSNNETRFARKTNLNNLLYYSHHTESLTVKPQWLSTSNTVRISLHSMAQPQHYRCPSHARQRTPKSVQNRILWSSCENVWWNRQSQNHWQRSTRHLKQKRTQIFRGRAAKIYTGAVATTTSTFVDGKIHHGGTYTHLKRWMESLSAIKKDEQKLLVSRSFERTMRVLAQVSTYQNPSLCLSERSECATDNWCTCQQKRQEHIYTREHNSIDATKQSIWI